MRDSSSDAGPLVRAWDRWCALDRGWRATLLGIGLVAAIAAIAP
jgi:hypothetical protein